MISTTEYTGAVSIEGEQLVRDLKSKAVLSIDKKALIQSRRQRESILVEKLQKQGLQNDICRLSSDIDNLKNELTEIKDLLKAALPVFINTNKTLL